MRVPYSGTSEYITVKAGDSESVAGCVADKEGHAGRIRATRPDEAL